MEVHKLTQQNVDLYLACLRRAMAEEPNEMTAEEVDETGIRKRLEDPFFQNTVSLLAMENGEVIGRLEYHFYGCLQDGCKMAYVDWVYVLPEHRHKGAARQLFQAFEQACIASGIDQYYLIRSEEENADRFYHAFPDAELTREPLLRKFLSPDQ